MKAIATGNPAVLTLAEADVELQRLAVLRRNHADEQFVARRKLKELPETIGRLEKRLDALTNDQQRVSGWKDQPLMIGGREYAPDEAMTPLARVLETVPAVSDRKFPVGKYRGLSFGVEYRWDTLDVYLLGEAECRTQLSKGAHGARAVMNALQRIANAYAERIGTATKELELSRKRCCRTTRPGWANPSATRSISNNSLHSATA